VVAMFPINQLVDTLPEQTCRVERLGSWVD